MKIYVAADLNKQDVYCFDTNAIVSVTPLEPLRGYEIPREHCNVHLTDGSDWDILVSSERMCVAIQNAERSNG